MNKLWVRLSFGFSVMVLGAVFIVALAGIFSNQRMATLLPSIATQELAGELAKYYQTHATWQGSELLLMGATPFNKRPQGDLSFFLTDANHRIIYHPAAVQIGQTISQTAIIQLEPIQATGQIFGYLGIESGPDKGPPGPLEAWGRTLLIIATMTGLSAVVFGSVMSRSFTAPLNNLATAAKAIGTRKFEQRVAERGSAELIAVAQAFNEMAHSIQQAEQLRRNLLADIAHELRSPLAVLQGNLRAILDEIYPLTLTEIARLYEHTRFLSRLVNDLHELAQAEAHQLPLKLQPTDLAHLATATVDSFRPSVDAKGVKLHMTAPDDLPLLEVDGARIRQVLQNLLANALRHTPTGGAIMVSVTPAFEGLRLSVADTGEGIQPEHLPYIFDRFYRADPARSRDRGGVGLGLAIARVIVQAHGGEITATSTGQGSTFMLQLPLAPSADVNAHPANNS